jgi:sugar lactone lactonase YvrE
MNSALPRRGRRTLADGLVFPEGPRWHDGRLWFVDMYAGELWAIDLDGKAERIARFDDHTGGLGFLPDGDALIVLKKTQKIIRLHGGRAEPYADLHLLGGNHLNDMVVDDAGRAYVDVRVNPPNYNQSPPETAEPAEDFIASIEPSGACKVCARDLLTPNGLAIDATGTRFVVAETRACRLTEYQRNPITGGLAGRRVLADLGGIRPDGICLDRKGAVWIGSPNTAQFARILRNGTIGESIPLPGRLGLACALGGPDRRTLFLMSAITTPEELAQDRARGFVEVTEVETSGDGIP